MITSAKPQIHRPTQMISLALILANHLVVLVGGSSPNEGNVFALNPATNHYGPVCDDLTTDATVSAMFGNFIVKIAKNELITPVAL